MLHMRIITLFKHNLGRVNAYQAEMFNTDTIARVHYEFTMDLSQHGFLSKMLLCEAILLDMLIL